MQKLLTSRRLWVFILAQLLAIAALVVGHYVTDPFGIELAKYVIGFVEGLAGFVILAYTVDDTAQGVAAIKAGTHPDYPPLTTPASPQMANGGEK